MMPAETTYAIAPEQLRGLSTRINTGSGMRKSREWDHRSTVAVALTLRHWQLRPDSPGREVLSKV